jgi:hypothetical protein
VNCVCILTRGLLSDAVAVLAPVRFPSA